MNNIPCSGLDFACEGVMGNDGLFLWVMTRQTYSYFQPEIMS